MCVLGAKKLQTDCTMAPHVAVQFSCIPVHLDVSKPKLCKKGRWSINERIVLKSCQM